MGKAKKGISTAEHELVAQYELFKVIAEQNHEKILEYEVINDTVRIKSGAKAQGYQLFKINYEWGDIPNNSFYMLDERADRKSVV